MAELDKKKALKVMEVCPPFRLNHLNLIHLLTLYMQEKQVVNVGQSIMDVINEFSSPVCMIQLHIGYVHHTPLMVCALLGQKAFH